jgi:hypothetical protein
MGFTLPPHKGPENFDFETINLFKNNFKEGVITNLGQLDGGKFFFNLDINKQASIPYKIKEKNGMIFCLKINTPYTMLEPKSKILTDINTAVDISNQIFF